MITTAEPVFYARTDAQRDEAHRRGLPNAETPVLVAFDEMTRGESALYVKECTAGER